MADVDRVYTPTVINDNPFPQDNQTELGTTQQTAHSTYSQESIKDTNFPDKRIAHELLSSSLNTKSKKILQEFQLAASGAIRVGQYEAGVSGDVSITPNGITARDETGSTTFNLDGTTGDANFAGNIQSGAVITGQVIVGNNNVIIDGANKRIIINDGTYDRVLLGFQSGGF